MDQDALHVACANLAGSDYFISASNEPSGCLNGKGIRVVSIIGAILDMA